MRGPLVIGVIGAATVGAPVRELAVAVGREIARHGWFLICGGLGGVMEAACRGAREAGGRTIGILPGTDRNSANAWVEIALPTGIADARNAIIARAAHACIAVGGEFGTLSEIAFCLKFGTPVVALESRWSSDVFLPELATVKSPQEACAWVERKLA